LNRELFTQPEANLNKLTETMVEQNFNYFVSVESKNLPQNNFFDPIHRNRNFFYKLLKRLQNSLKANCIDLPPAETALKNINP
jgi:hypothetical protein